MNPGCTYRNIKNGGVYGIISLAIDCTNSRDGNKVVVYHSLESPVQFYVRDLEEFKQKFEPLVGDWL